MNSPKPSTLMFDFWASAPESLHRGTMLFSDRGTPDGYRNLHGFGSHTDSLINVAGERVWVKWHLTTQQGIKNLSAAQAVRLAGEDPEHAEDDYGQAGNLFRLLPPEQQENLFDNMAGPLSQVPEAIQARSYAPLDQADPRCGAAVRAAVAVRTLSRLLSRLPVR